ncbi:hypothetical protein [Algoriphagus sp. A40]|uniref:hypothetical protein n=1 Tax=Algoriphagus sp. A40 TaxID=1945863 RepID=UPI00098706AA|nr:hypothetical protein [Algoriphagus sp. A40]OOG76764.1 hypothetical protein B0E43_07180 [Algoriphagus sp. A40]
MKWNSVIDKALEVLRTSDRGYVLMDMYNNILTPEEAAFNKVQVTPYNALKFIQTQFSAMGLDISDKNVRVKLIALLEEFDRLQKERIKS